MPRRKLLAGYQARLRNKLEMRERRRIQRINQNSNGIIKSESPKSKLSVADAQRLATELLNSLREPEQRVTQIKVENEELQTENWESPTTCNEEMNCNDKITADQMIEALSQFRSAGGTIEAFTSAYEAMFDRPVDYKLFLQLVQKTLILVTQSGLFYVANCLLYPKDDGN